MFFKVPSLLLKQLYTFGSLANEGGGIRFTLKNRLSDATVTGIRGVSIDGRAADLAGVTLDLGDGSARPARELSAASPLPFPLRRIVTVRAAGFAALGAGDHEIEIAFDAEPFGEMTVKVHDAIAVAAAAKRVADPLRQIGRPQPRVGHQPAALRRRVLGPPDRAPRQVLVRPGDDRAATSRTSSAWRRFRSASPGRCR